MKIIRISQFEEEDEGDLDQIRAEVQEELEAREAIASRPISFRIPECCPFPRDDDFAKIFTILYVCRHDGISKPGLTTSYQRWTLKDDIQADQDVNAFLKKGGYFVGDHEYTWEIGANGMIVLHFDRVLGG